MTDDAELEQKTQAVKKRLAVGPCGPELFAYIVTELLSAVDAKSSDYRAFCLLGSECASRIGQPRAAALLLAFAKDVAGALERLPANEAHVERAHLLWALARTDAKKKAALCKQAAQEASRAGRKVTAALLQKEAGDDDAALLEWEGLLRAGLPTYEQSLVYAQLALAKWNKDTPQARAEGRRCATLCGQLLEEVANEHETNGRNALALDCYRVLALLGKRGGAFENTAEGYLGLLRIVQTERLVGETVRLFDELFALAKQAGEHEFLAAEGQAAARFCQRFGLSSKATDYLRQAKEAFLAVAQARADAGSVRLAKHALLSALSMASVSGSAVSGGGNELVELVQQVARFASDPTEAARFAVLAERIAQTPTSAHSGSEAPTEDLDAGSASASIAIQEAEVWTTGLLEWQAQGLPDAVALPLVLDPERPELVRRHALLVVLSFAPRMDEQTLLKVVGSLGSLRAFEAVRPLERLFRESQSPGNDKAGARFRQAILEVLPRLPFPPSLELVVSALSDRNPQVQQAAQTAAVKLGTPELLGAFVQLFSETSELSVKRLAVGAFSRIGDARAIEQLLSVYLHAPEEVLRSDARRALLVVRHPSAKRLFEVALRQAGPERKDDLRLLFEARF